MAQLYMPPIPMKMYRHFAAVTVALTACLAFFADGEKREAVANHIEERERQAEIEAKSDALFGQSELTRAEPDQSHSSFDDMSEGTQTGSKFGRPTDNLNGIVNTFPGASGTTRALIAGYSRSYIEGLSDEEYEQLVRSMQQAENGMNGDERERNRRSLESRSRMRSGTPTVIE